MAQGRALVYELTLEELTSEAMLLIHNALADLYVVLGCQLMGTMRPARVAALWRYQSALQELIEAQDSGGGSAADWRKGVAAMADELRHEGIRFLDSIADDLRKVFNTPEILHCLDEITPATMQIIVLMAGAVLRMPPQLEAISATIAAILCRRGIREFCAGH